jgi:hypothetical protein
MFLQQLRRDEGKHPRHPVTSPSSKAVLSKLGRSELIARCKKLASRRKDGVKVRRKQKRNSELNFEEMEKRIEEIRKKDIFDTFEEPARSLVCEMRRMAGFNAKGRRYTPKYIEHCLEMNYFSPRLYRHLLQDLKFPMPSERTLRNHLAKVCL